MATVIKVLPAVAGMVVTVRKIDLVNTFDTSSTAISTLPEECEYLVVLDLAQRVGLNKISALTLSSLTSSLVAPTAPSVPSFTYTDAFKQVVTPTLVGDLGTVPYYFKPSMASLVSLVSTQVPPSVPTITSVNIGVIPSAPVFVPSSLPAIVLAASTAFDTAMTNEDVELANAQVAKLNQGMSQYQSAIQENLGEFNGDLEKFKAEVQKIISQAQISEQQNAVIINKYQAEVEAYGQKVNADVAIYTANMKRIVETYQSDIQNEMNRANTEIQKYQVTLQTVLKQLEVTANEAQVNATNATNVDVKNREQQLLRQVQEYQATLKLFEDKISIYAQQIQSELGIYQANSGRVKVEIERLLALISSFKQEYYETLSTKFGVNINMNKDKEK